MVEGLNWDDRAWRRQARGWIDESLHTRGMQRSGDLEQVRARPWSVVLRAATPGGAYYFKALPPLLKHEVLVLEFLSDRFPGRVPSLLAADPGRGWMLQLDGGALLREQHDAGTMLEQWHRVLSVYAELQQGAAEFGGELISAGVPDRRPGKLPGLLEALLDDRSALHLDHPNGLAESTRFELLQMRSKLVQICQRLDDGRVPASLEHSDLHDRNVFLRQGRAVIFDWGDCSLAHPFSSLRTTFVSLENGLGWAQDDRRLSSIADLYLQRWTDWAPLAALRAELKLVLATAPLIAALRWRRALRLLPAGQQDYVEPIPRLLEELLEKLRACRV